MRIDPSMAEPTIPMYRSIVLVLQLASQLRACIYVVSKHVRTYLRRLEINIYSGKYSHHMSTGCAVSMRTYVVVHAISMYT